MLAEDTASSSFYFELGTSLMQFLKDLLLS